MSPRRIQKKNQIQIEFGKRLKLKRQELGFTQEQLAEKAGLTYSYVGSIERGERNVSLGNIIALASALMISPKELMPNSQQPEKAHIKVELGKRLKSKRLERGLSEEQLSQKSNLTLREIEQAELGEGCVSVDSLVALARALKISPRELLPEGE